MRKHLLKALYNYSIKNKGRFRKRHTVHSLGVSEVLG